jgi:hypothetical protein
VRLLPAVASTAGTGYLLWHIVVVLRGSTTAPWNLGRASGLVSYSLLTLLVIAGLLLSHPTVRRLRRPSQLTRIRLHITLAAFTLVFTLLHVVVLATDPWSQVGWLGALLPMASRYRPVGVTLGVLAVWSGLAAGLTAALAGRALGGVWWPLHKVAGLAFLLAWAHGVIAGSDSATFLVIYLASGGMVLVLALSRYQAGTAADLRDGLTTDRVNGAPALAVVHRQREET